MKFLAMGDALWQKRRRLEELEDTIGAGLRCSTTIEVGKALREVRDDRLYLVRAGGDFRTFEDYCRSVWHMGRRYLNRLIDSYDSFVAVEQLGPIGPNCASEITEGVLRPLARLVDPQAKREAFGRALSLSRDEGVPVAQRHVESVVREMLSGMDLGGRESQFSPIIKPMDNWNFALVHYARIDGEAGHGYIPGDLYANCLWYWTKQGDSVVAPMAGSGQIKRVYDDRDVWMRPSPWDLDIKMFDLNPRGMFAEQIIYHDLTSGFPVELADYVIMDLPYFGMVDGQYSTKQTDLANMNIGDWQCAVASIARWCAGAQHQGGLCTAISPNYSDVSSGAYVVVTDLVREAFVAAGYRLSAKAYASRRIQQDQNPGMGRLNNSAKANKVMLTDISEVMTFSIAGAVVPARTWSETR